MGKNAKEQESTSKVAKKWPRDHVNHWREKVFFQRWTDEGGGGAVSSYCVRIQVNGQRRLENLGTGNREEAARKARDLYLRVKQEGWDAVKPPKPQAAATPPTVGQVLEVMETRATHLSPNSLKQYATALRQLGGEIAGIRVEDVGRQNWRGEVAQVQVESLTPQAVREWRTRRLREASDAVSQAKRLTHINSLIRNARGCFAPQMQPHFEDAGLGALPCPFQGVKLERPKRSRLYRSEIDQQQLINAIAALEPGDLRMTLIVALTTGLRRSEIDRLRWTHIDFQACTLSVEPTEDGAVKSYHSERTLHLEPWVVEEFRKHRKRGTDRTYVIGGARRVSASYRAEETFRRAIQLLRAWGINGTHPLHTLRKEFGSQIATRWGVAAAAKTLGHADYSNVTALYVDAKGVLTSGLVPTHVDNNDLAVKD